jgi:phage-related tail protein
VKLSTIVAVVAIATTVSQMLYSLLSGGFTAGSQLESVQTELKLIRRDISSQYQLIQSQNQLYEYRLQNLEKQQSEVSK